MTSDNRQPFIDSRAFEKANSTYVPFPSQADAMLASLQLFHDVPCRIMNLICSVVTHPDFDSKQLTLRNSADVIDVVEENRLKDRMVVVQERSASRDGCVEQAGLPQSILDEVLDIIHAERMTSIKALFEETLDEETMYFDSMHMEEDDTLKAMTRVHRTWTTLAQKALGRVLHIGRPTREMNIFLSPVRKSIFGPWTSAVAVQFFRPVEQKKLHYCETCYQPDEPENEYDFHSFRYDCAEVIDKEGCRQWFETLHRILVGFTNLKCLYIKSYHSLFISWSDLTFGEMIRRNVRLEEVTVYVVGDKAFDLDSLVENAAVLKSLRNLNVEGASISDATVQKAMQGPGFACLTNVTIKCCFTSFESDLRLLSILSSQSNSRLESLRIVDAYGIKTFEEDIARALTSLQCAAIFDSLRALHIDSLDSADKWFKWIGPYCSSLESLSIMGDIDTASQCTTVPGHLRSLHINSRTAYLWLKLIGSYCPSLESLSIVDNSSRSFFEENVRRASSFPQSTFIFDRLYILRINCTEAADLWLQWISPYCTGLHSIRLTMMVSLTPEILDLIPITVCTLDLELWTTQNSSVEQVTDWMKCLLRIASSRKLSKLKSFTLFISKDKLLEMEYRDHYKQQLHSLRTEMQTFKDEMSTVCEGVGINFYLNI